LELLQAGLAGLDATDATDLPDGQVRDEVAALLVAFNQLTAVLSQRVGVFDARGLCEDDGLRTTRTWLTAFGRMSQGAASGWLSRARLLRELPALAAAAGRGEVSAEHVAKVDALASRVGIKEAAGFDEILADVSSRANPAETQRACERIAAHLDPDGAGPDPERDFERREITFSRLGSMLCVRGRLDAEGGAALMSAVDAWMRPPGPGDTRTAAQRRADALVELARQLLAQGELPTVGGVRPQLGILITPQALLGLQGSGPAGDSRSGSGSAGAGPAGAKDRPGRPDRLTEAGIPPLPEPPWLHWIGQIPPELAQRIACDSDVWRIVLDPATGLPLNVGRSHRIVPYWMRKALHARDRTCRWPGCDTPAQWTDAHHAELPWYYGGQTNIDEIISLCRWHHGRVHEGRWTLTLDHTTGEVTITRPDGTPYELGPSQPHRPTSGQSPHHGRGPSTPTGRSDEAGGTPNGLPDAA
jgi:hypothetical protein